MPLFSSSFSGTSSLCHSPRGPRSPCLQEALLPGRETNQAEGLFGRQEPLQVGDGTPSGAHLSGPAADLARTATRGCLFSEGSRIRTRSWLLRVHSLDAARGSSTQRWSAFPRRIAPSPSPVLKGSLKTAQGMCEASFHNLSHLMHGVSVPWRSPKEGSGVPTRPTLKLTAGARRHLWQIYRHPHCVFFITCSLPPLPPCGQGHSPRWQR